MRELWNSNLHWLLTEEAHAIYRDCMYDHSYDAYYRAMSDYIQREQSRCFYCVQNGKPVGILVFDLREDGSAEVVGIATHLAHRGEGIGTYMLREGIKTLGCHTVTATTDKDAVFFYLKYGFTLMNKEVKTYPDGEVCRYTCIWE
jgi:ribosomal protein S18 acetylase RimI-like enzyme